MKSFLHLLVVTMIHDFQLRMIFVDGRRRLKHLPRSPIIVLGDFPDTSTKRKVERLQSSAFVTLLASS